MKVFGVFKGGGVVSNTPAWALDDERAKLGVTVPTLVFRLEEKTSTPLAADAKHPRSLSAFIQRLGETAIEGDELLQYRQVENLHLIQLKVQASTFSIELDDVTRTGLYDAGFAQADNYGAAGKCWQSRQPVYADMIAARTSYGQVYHMTKYLQALIRKSLTGLLCVLVVSARIGEGNRVTPIAVLGLDTDDPILSGILERIAAYGRILACFGVDADNRRGDFVRSARRVLMDAKLNNPTKRGRVKKLMEDFGANCDAETAKLIRVVVESDTVPVQTMLAAYDELTLNSINVGLDPDILGKDNRVLRDDMDRLNRKLEQFEQRKASAGIGETVSGRPKTY